MVKIENLKNNSKGRSVLKSLIADKDALCWLMSVLPDLPLDGESESWKILLLDYEDELRTLMQHHDPVIRCQSCGILMTSASSTTRRLLWDMFSDSHQSIRSVMVREFKSDDRQKMYNTLFKIYLRDPVFIVRQASLGRIKKDFSDLYTLNPEKLEDEEKIHSIELLDIHSSHDHSLALRFMKDSIPGIVLAASIYLEKSGTLDKMISTASGRDLDDLDRKLGILKTAAAHQITSFLNKRENFKSKGSLYLAVEILQAGTVSTIFSWLIRKVMTTGGQNGFTKNLKNAALSCLLTRKDPESYSLIKEMLESRETSESHMILLLENLPAEGVILFYPVLHRFLVDSQFLLFPALVAAFDKVPLSLCLSDLYSLIRDSGIEREIQKRAFILLSRYKEFSSTLFLIENLSLLNEDEMKALGIQVFSLNKTRFLYSAEKIFGEHDSYLHQKLMHLCSLSGIREFIPVMIDKLSDSDPQSRTRAVWSLRTLGTEEYISSIVPLLYDPVPAVRSQTAAALIDWNRGETFNSMISILNDRTESFSVQESIIESLGLSRSLKSVEILVTLLRTNSELKEKTLSVLLGKQSHSEIELIVKLYESASLEVKKQLNGLFKNMGETAEPMLMDLLVNTTDLQTRHNICSILDSTGYVESLIGKLKSSSSARRLDAAEKLSAIGTLKASRGLLFGARDINRNIRIMSLKALVRIQKNTEVLSVLENDPDKKVRRYASWAKERIRAENLP